MKNRVLKLTLIIAVIIVFVSGGVIMKDVFMYKYSRDCVPSERAAISIANAVFTSVSSDVDINDYDIFTKEDKGKWIVSYANKNENYLGGIFQITINKNNGLVERIHGMK